MSFKEKLVEELKAIALTTLYFAVWLGVLMVLKKLILAEYHIHFKGLSMALIGALVLAKVVLILEHVPLGEWIDRRPAVYDVIVRTTFYAFGVLIVLLLEKAFEARHEYGGFLRALTRVFEHPDIPHVLANTICTAGALLVFNALTIVQEHLGEHGLGRLFLSQSPKASKTD